MIAHSDVLEDSPLCLWESHLRIAVTSDQQQQGTNDDSRPEPGPLAVTSTDLRPCSCADLAASEAI